MLETETHSSFRDDAPRKSTQAQLSMQEKLIFVISPPRAGSTLLQRMLGSHSQVFTHPEPHLVTPLAYLGYYDKVEKSRYDHINSAEAMKLFVSHLPGGETDYYDALRAYSDTLYGRMLATSDKTRFLDKTPAYALVLPFLAKLYPGAKYVVLTRHPLAVLSSYAESFFDGSYERAQAFNPILERYVPAMADFIRKKPVDLIQVEYETLVASPESELARIFGFLGLPNEPGAVKYGDKFDASKSGPGDPINVGRHDRPVTASVEKWAAELAHDEAKRRIAEETIARLSDADLETWKHPRSDLFEPLTRAGVKPRQKRVLNRYTIERRIFLALRENIHERPHGKLLQRLRYYCDVLLRE